jgi:hypothetical protein
MLGGVIGGSVVDPGLEPQGWEQDIASSAHTSVTRREHTLFREHILLTWYKALR